MGRAFAEDFADLSLSALEQLAASKEQELQTLARYNYREGVGARSYGVSHSRNAKRPLQVTIPLRREAMIDQVTLVPSLWKDPSRGIRSEGFPRTFRVIVGTEENEHVVAAYDDEAYLAPRVAPLRIQFPPTLASWVRIEVDQLSANIGEKSYSFQLSEALVFSGAENIALHQLQGAKGRLPYLTDGFTPFLMDAAEGVLSKRNIFRPQEETGPFYLNLDLGEQKRIDQVNIHTENVTAALAIPKRNLDIEPTPRHIQLLASTTPNFHDAIMLYEKRVTTADDIGHIYQCPFAPTEARYLRLVILDPRPIVTLQNLAPYIAYGEIEVLSAGKSVGQGAEVIASTNLSSHPDHLTGLTDGKNYYGEILPMREWMNQLSRRHILEYELRLLQEELAIRYSQQKGLIRLWITLAVIALIGGSIAAVVMARNYHRKVRQMRERMAADLHDELGANLHAIGLLSDMAEESSEKPQELMDLLERVGEISRRSSLAVQRMSIMQESSEHFMGLESEMRRATERILTQATYDFSLTGTEHLDHLPERLYIDLYLFYKECLINICRHAQATEVTTRLQVTSRDLTLVVSDNGQGIPPEHLRPLPRSLKRRSDLLRAKVSVDSPEEGGTTIILKLKNRQ